MMIDVQIQFAKRGSNRENYMIINDLRIIDSVYGDI